LPGFFDDIELFGRSVAKSSRRRYQKRPSMDAENRKPAFDVVSAKIVVRQTRPDLEECCGKNGL
jgi:hypothetical protein